MSRLKDMIRDTPVHERRLELRSFPIGDDRLIVEGSLRDDRLIQGYHWDGKPRQPGVVHLMRVRLLVGGQPLTILDAEAEMPQIPHELCPTTLESIKKIVGLTIVHGYSEQVNALLGGVNGCNHLTHLVLVLGTAALHGYWTHKSREPRPAPHSLDEVGGLPNMINSCKLWAENGPLMQKLEAFIEGGGRS